MGKSVEEIRAEIEAEDAAKAGNTITDVSTGLSQKAKPSKPVGERAVFGSPEHMVEVQKKHDELQKEAQESLESLAAVYGVSVDDLRYDLKHKHIRLGESRKQVPPPEATAVYDEFLRRHRDFPIRTGAETSHIYGMSDAPVEAHLQRGAQKVTDWLGLTTSKLERASASELTSQMEPAPLVLPKATE